MGTEPSKIETLSLPVTTLKATAPINQTKFCPPFRTFSNQEISLSEETITASIEITSPISQRISITETHFADLELAFDIKTKDILIHSVLEDPHYSDMKVYLAKENNKNITLQLRNFASFNTFAFNSLIVEVYVNEEIRRLGCQYLNKIQENYVIETGLGVEGEENPNTQVFIMEPIETNLSEIIKYRRENNWEWSIGEFNGLVYDICHGLKALHDAGFSHNDIRPCNIYFSLSKNCYQLGNFSSCQAITPSKLMSSSIRISSSYMAPELSTSINSNLQYADIYSLGISLLSAFYLVEPINISETTSLNKKLESTYPILNAIKEMLKPIERRSNIGAICQQLSKGSVSIKMNNFIESLRYRSSPKEQKLVSAKKSLSEAYQRLGLWNDWKDQNYEAYELEENSLDDFKKANSLAELAKIESCRGDLQCNRLLILASSEYAKSASKLYRNLGYTAYEQSNLEESLNLFTKAINCSKYFENNLDMDMAKNLQGLALIHSEKGDYEVSKPLIKEACTIVVKNLGKKSIDFCKIRMSEAKIETDFGQFEKANLILNECLETSEEIIKKNEEQGLKLKAELLSELGRNAMQESSEKYENQQILIGKAEKYITDSIVLNQEFSRNWASLASNMEILGELELRKNNFVTAKNNFEKAEQLRLQHEEDNPDKVLVYQKEKAESLCNIAACETGLGNHQQALINYNKAIELYKTIYGSDHNKYSAMAIGNMSKVYYMMNDKEKSKDCVKLATSMLSDLMGESDADCQHFKNMSLEETFM